VVATTLTTLLMCNKKFLVDIYVWDFFIDDTCMDETLMCMDDTYVYG
jgi:hypothetical protein